jgi:hypothetical protein
MTSFRKFIEQSKGDILHSFSQNTVGKHNDFATASFLPSTWTGSDSLGKMSYGPPDTDLELPRVEAKSKIKLIEKNKNPIRIQLMDGTNIYLTVDEFRRIDSTTRLDVGREITVIFQRREGDRGDQPSQIISVR